MDGGSPYAIRTSKLFYQLGLNSDGKLPSQTPSLEKAIDRDVKSSMSCEKYGYCLNSLIIFFAGTSADRKLNDSRSDYSVTNF